MPPVLDIRDLKKHFPIKTGLLSKPSRWIKAVDGVSIRVEKGESFGLVGESGCGKSTLGRLILRLLEPTSGSIFFLGENITGLNRSRMRPLRKKMQIIFQDPYSSLDPRLRVSSIVTEPLRAFNKLSKVEERKKAEVLLAQVGLSTGDMDRRPHEFSGGQRQRICIARALAPGPELIVADEPVSALDVSIQAQVLNLLNDLKKVHNLSYVFISHNLTVVEQMCDRIAVMYLGRIVESAPAAVLFKQNRHPYTKTLLDAVPIPNPRKRHLPKSLGAAPQNPHDPTSGCPFHPRCRDSGFMCRKHTPPLTYITPDHAVSCWGVY